jgi:uncharacterized protein (TIGR00369 family)
MASIHVAKDPAFRDRIRDSFAKQGLMATLGASLTHIAPGLVEIVLPATPAVSQQHGYVHAGALAAVADSAAGYAALSLMPAGVGVLSVEFKINLLAPATGDRVKAKGRVVKAGRTITVAHAEVFSESGADERLVALLTATVMMIEGRRDVAD